MRFILWRTKKGGNVYEKEATVETTAAYDTVGNYVLSQTDARGKTLTTVTHSDKGTTESVTDPNGQTVNYTYDTLRRVTKVSTQVNGNKHDIYRYFTSYIQRKGETDMHSIKCLIKRMYLLFLLFVLNIICIVPYCTAENGQYEYVIENNEITITRYIGNETEVSIPSEIDGVPVTEVGFAAFYGTQIKTVVIGEGIRRIGVDAFSETGLISVSLPSTLEVIEDSAFAISPLKTAVIPDGVKSIGETLFYGCTDLTEVTLPKSIEILPSGCFFECMSLKRIEIPEGLREIGDQCFYFCISLEECLLPESLNVIGCEAFALCSALPALDIPASVCCLKGGCFWDCTSLERIVFHSDIVVDENWDEYMFGQWRDLTPQRLAITAPVGSGIASFCAGMGLNVEVQ